ncbi:MAG TPA: hypothetical protein VEG32_07020 [Clostridia bacterium]|nr:hypothetical protein [Clostridia bacterium]
MPRRPARNPHPKVTVWLLLGTVVGLLVLVALLAISRGSKNLPVAVSGAGVPALVVVVIIVAGAVGIATVLSRTRHPR